MKEIKGDLIKLAKAGEFDVIGHGCNCFCTMGAGIAPQMHKAFGCNNPDLFSLEGKDRYGDRDKLGEVQYIHWQDKLYVLNMYTQHHYYKPGPNGIPLQYDALEKCLTKVNDNFAGKKVGLPLIGCGLAGGDWKKVKQIFEDCLTNCDLTVVHYKK